MKKAIATIAVSGLLLTALPMTAFAHSGSRVSNQAYAICQVENCNTTGNHKHDGTTYAGHYTGDGHEYHQVCSAKNCTKTGSHDHNGVTCLPHSNTDGHSYHGSSHRSGSHH